MSTYTPIASQTLSSAAASVTFSGIPQTYTDLVLVANVGCSSASQRAGWQVNSNTGSNYSRTILVGTGSSTASDRESNATAAYGIFDATNGVPTTLTGNFITQFQNYSNTTTNKTALTRYNDAGGGTGASVQLWRSTSAITSITFLLSGGNWLSGSTFNLYGVANAGITNTAAKATGGESVYTDGTYWYHIFRSSGIFAPNVILSNVDFLVIAGGGAGGYGYGGAGGGGAGGYRTSAGTSGGGAAAESKLSLAVQNYTVTVGAGGAANDGFGNNGSNSVFSTITSIGGGVGGRGTGGGYSGQNGGSGGGGGSTNRDSGGSGTANQGYNGGSAENSNGGGGGGGAGAVGSNAQNGGSGGGNGGAGVASTITGSSVTRAGGGGGGAYSGGSAGSAGSGGAGAGGGTGGNATANTGSGGGGGGYSTSNGGNGGSGIVIVRYSV